MAKHFRLASDEATPPAPGSPKVAPASPKELERAESDHVDDGKSDTLEEFTSPVKNGTPAVEDEGTKEADVADKAAAGETPAEAGEEAPKGAEEAAPGEDAAGEPDAAEPAASGADKEEAAEEKK